MVHLQFKDLDDTYKGMCDLPFHRLEEFKDDLFISGSWWMYGVDINIKSYSCTIDMSVLNYTMLKWKALKTKYIDFDKYNGFKEYVASTSSKTATFNFKEHGDKGGCLVAMVLTRHDNSKPFDKLTIHYRVTEVFKKFAIDLILINKICNDLSAYNCDIKEITLFLPALFYRGEFMAELIGGYHHLEEFDLDNVTCNKIRYLYNRFYGEGAEESNYHSIQRKQKLKKRNDKLEPIPIGSLFLD